jgi:transposase
MTRGKAMSQSKIEFLKNEGLLNPRPQAVQSPEFRGQKFFDPLDLPQVRYEMLRAARVGTRSVAEACRQFGFSREYFYQLERAFSRQGYMALISTRTGRRPILALNQEIIAFILHRKLELTSVSGEQLRQEIRQHYKVNCSLRTVQRIVEKLGFRKKGRRKQ